MRKLILLTLALAVMACSPKGGKPRMVWIEVGANFAQYANSQENIQADCQRLAQGGFTHIVVEVRPTSGDVLFKSATAPALKEVHTWNGTLERTADFDYLQAFLDAGHAAGLKVLAGMNVMVGGFRAGDGSLSGMLASHPERRDWAAVDHTSRGLVNHLDDNTIGGRFLDPANPEVQEYALALVQELAAYKDLDGIVLDRCRYDDYALDAGYTEAGRLAFSEYLGRNPERWPVFAKPGRVFLNRKPDPLELSWLTFRCRVIRDFVDRAVRKAHAVRPELPVGLYVGAWFSEYYRSGVNWSSPHYALAAEERTYRWATPAYQATGLADLVDFLILGAYCPADNVYGEEENTSEGYARLGRKRLCGEVPFYSGPDVGNEPGYGAGGRAQTLRDIAAVMDREADGFFLFDLCHVRAFDYWDALKGL